MEKSSRKLEEKFWRREVGLKVCVKRRTKDGVDSLRKGGNFQKENGSEEERSQYGSQPAQGGLIGEEKSARQTEKGEPGRQKKTQREWPTEATGRSL